MMAAGANGDSACRHLLHGARPSTSNPFHISASVIPMTVTKNMRTARIGGVSSPTNPYTNNVTKKPNPLMPNVPASSCHSCGRTRNRWIAGLHHGNKWRHVVVTALTHPSSVAIPPNPIRRVHQPGGYIVIQHLATLHAGRVSMPAWRVAKVTCRLILSVVKHWPFPSIGRHSHTPSRRLPRSTKRGFWRSGATQLGHRISSSPGWSDASVPAGDRTGNISPLITEPSATDAIRRQSTALHPYRRTRARAGPTGCAKRPAPRAPRESRNIRPK